MSNWDYGFSRPSGCYRRIGRRKSMLFYGWIHQLGTVKENESEEKGRDGSEAGTDWIYDSSYLSG